MPTLIVVVAIVGVAIFLGLAVVWARRDYLAWTALGPGGLPHTLGGWIRLTRLRIGVARLDLDVRDADALEKRQNGTGAGPFLSELPQRGRTRPAVAPYPIPHRLASDPADAETTRILSGAFAERAAKAADRALMARSNFERHNDAVTARCIRFDNRDALLSHGEIGHVHPSDGSMHLVMHPRDAAAAIRAGWGELHPLSGQGLLPGAYLFVYPPTSREEISVILQLLDAAIAYVADCSPCAGSMSIRTN